MTAVIDPAVGPDDSNVAPADRRGLFNRRHGSTSLRVGAATLWLSVIVLLPLA
ncbi:MAG: molybdate ABC transporter permease subunit, partial [Mycobacterium sp.]